MVVPLQLSEHWRWLKHEENIDRQQDDIDDLGNLVPGSSVPLNKTLDSERDRVHHNRGVVKSSSAWSKTLLFFVQQTFLAFVVGGERLRQDSQAGDKHG